MEIEWVNHASYILRHKTLSLICDPWFEGTAFDNGWALLADSVFTPDSFKDITHIWFSHEHPDHFNPPNLAKIPKECRNKITVLYQKTTDHKVAEYCKKAGFANIVEMDSDRYYSLSDSLEVMCNPFTDGDSWIYFKTQETGILNLNDCVINTREQAENIKSKIGTVDVLLTQFGYANKVGNRIDIEKRKMASAEKLNRLKLQNEIFKPNTIIPFASFVYFCHEENYYMNEGMNRIDVVADFIENELKTKTLILYPGDIWKLGDLHNNDKALERYNLEYLKLDSGKKMVLKSGESVSIESLKSEAKRFSQKLLPYFKLNFQLPGFSIWLTDYKASFVFNLKKGFCEASIEEDLCDIQLSSESLHYSFKFFWGGDTLQINARFQTTESGAYQNVRDVYELASKINRAENISTMALIKGQLRKIKTVAKVAKALKWN